MGKPKENPDPLDVLKKAEEKIDSPLAKRIEPALKDPGALRQRELVSLMEAFERGRMRIEKAIGDLSNHYQRDARDESEAEVN